MEISFEWGTTKITIRAFIILNIIKKFADDTKVFRRVNNYSDKQEEKRLRGDQI